jgi:acetyl-CoA carboxylase biotin carboxyl carrier protein
MKIEKKNIEELVKYLKEYNLSEIEYADGTTKVKVSRSINNLNTVSTEVSNKKQQIESNARNVTSPIVGTAYLAPEPSAKKFIEVGQKVKKGQTIMIIEAMKTMNHVPSTENGTISKVFVKDGEPVEFGQPLIAIE